MTITLLETNNAGEVVEVRSIELSDEKVAEVKALKGWPEVAMATEGCFSLEDFDVQSARYMRVGGIVI